MLSRKAQITIFVILGLVILFSIVTVIFFSLANTKSESELAYRKFTGPIDRGKIQTLVEGCIDLAAKPAILRMASQGGYLNIPVDEFYVPQIPVTGIHPRMIQPVAPMTKAKLVNIPYAYFNGEEHFPTIEHMQDELSAYVQSEVVRCLDNFSAFKYDLNFYEKNPLTVSTVISEESVSFDIKYPIEFKSKDKKRSFTFDVFRDDVELRLGRTRELARQITNYQAKHNFLENATLEILAFSGLPYEGIELTCDDKSWTIAELEEKLKPYLINNFPYLKLKNTKFNDSEFYNNYYRNKFLVDFTDDDFSDIRVDAFYNDFWDINMDVYPKEEGNIVKPLEVGIEYALMCVKTYHHRYDLNFPVLFRIQDHYRDTTLVYNLVIPVSMRKNAPFKNDLYIPYGNGALLNSKEMYCTSDAKEYGPVEVRAMDSQTDEYISNVSIKFICGDIFSCSNLGKIDYPRQGSLKIAGKKPKFVGMMPVCNGATLELSAPDYETTRQSVNTVPSDKSHSMGNLNVVYMNPQKNIKYVVKVATDVNNPDLYRGLLKNEMAVVTLKTDDENEYDKTVYYPTNISKYQTIPITQSFDEKKYSLDVKIFRGNYESNNLSEVIRGGLVTGAFYMENITFSYADLEQSDTLVIYAVSRDTPFSNTEDFYNYYQEKILPNMQKFGPVLQ